MNDKELVEGIKKKDNKAYEVLYSFCYPSIKKHILNWNGNNSDVQDIFQEALIILTRKINEDDFVQKKENGGVAGYLHIIAVNLWKNEVKRRKNTPLKDYDQLIVSSTSNLESTNNEKKFEIVKDVLDELSYECRKLLIGFYYEKKSLKEIANELAYTHAFVRVKKARCLKAFKEKVLIEWEKKIS